MTGARTPSPGRPRPRRTAAGLRRWPEYTAAGLVLALGLGLGSLLLDGKRRPAEEVAAPQPPSTIPVSPGAVTGLSSSAPAAPSAPSQAQAGTIPPAPATPPAPKIPPPVLPEPRRLPAPPTPAKPETAAAGTPASASQTPAAQASAAQTPVTQAPVAQAPAAQAPVNQAPTPAAATPARPQPEAPATPEAGAPAQTQSEPDSPAPAPAAGTPAVSPSAQRTPLRSEYRVMLGTFGSEAALRSATAGVGALGYTVYAIDLGNQFVAQVGPFPDEATGQQAAADIRRAYARAELYPPRGRTLQTTAAASASAAPDPAAPAAVTPDPPASEPAAPTEAAAPPAPLPAPAGPVYVQVGAFNTVEGAQRFVEQLRAQGFTPSVNAPETGKVTVLLGPLSGDALLAAEGRLDAAGLDHFRLR
ncbi:SPOR domain-containing protein [Deinococcus wulumuqiensis]|uniref:SPOR domain-containing protein n=1 Tax=Deinococcus wulumuqiensis TaxID=980427 RepID=A0A345IGQ9_9DEIO|nr:SPOR domain-containing protein [Deinococcus wulumuqiensis]AXG98881.1 SPOR domain-containing protein [Deinococcus wulumuqiensis]